MGAVVVTPIMCWLAGVEGPVGQFNQTMVVQAPAGVAEADVVVVLEALLDRHAMLRLRVGDDGAGGWSLNVPEAGSVEARGCVQTVEVLSEAVLMGARSRLDPTAGVMLSAVWVAATGQLVLVVHHLAVDGVSWRILLEDLNIAWAQHRCGQPVALPVGATSFRRWASLLDGYARRPDVVDLAGVWRQVAAAPAVLPAVRPCGGYLCQCGAVGGGVGRPDDPAVVGAGARGVSCRDPRHFGDRVRAGGGAVCGHRRADRYRCGGSRARRGLGA